MVYYYEFILINNLNRKDQIELLQIDADSFYAACDRLMRAQTSLIKNVSNFTFILIISNNLTYKTHFSVSVIRILKFL